MAYHLLARTKGSIRVGGINYNYTPGDIIQVPDQFVDLARSKSKGTLTIIQKDGIPLEKKEPFTEVFVRTLLNGTFEFKDGYVKQAESYLYHLESISPINVGLINIVNREFGQYPSVAAIIKRLLTTTGINEFIPTTEKLTEIKERIEATSKNNKEVQQPEVKQPESPKVEVKQPEPQKVEEPIVTPTPNNTVETPIVEEKSVEEKIIHKRNRTKV